MLHRVVSINELIFHSIGCNGPKALYINNSSTKVCETAHILRNNYVGNARQLDPISELRVSMAPRNNSSNRWMVN